eukprot:TRINITY_DN69112_c0_g1_i1.p1 TRINITY_DN69112_c0_g1~~TRINITY_DN69112_c0_g1_i1.p1  ORF type:complete len:380 (+),score=43.19 TRINITY_DN69112_c0_g1_i1:53-1141(+)
MAALDWPLSHEEQKIHVFRTYDRELKAVSGLLQARREDDGCSMEQTVGDIADSEGRARPLRMSGTCTPISSVIMETDSDEDSQATSWEATSAREVPERLRHAVDNANAALDELVPARAEARRQAMCRGHSEGASAFEAVDSDGRRVDIRCRTDFPQRAQRGMYTPRLHRLNTPPVCATRRRSDRSAVSRRQAVSCQLETCESENSSCEADCEEPFSASTGPTSRGRGYISSRRPSGAQDTLPLRPLGAKQEDTGCRNEGCSERPTSTLGAKTVTVPPLALSPLSDTADSATNVECESTRSRSSVVDYASRGLSVVLDLLWSHRASTEVPEDPLPSSVDSSAVIGGNPNQAPLMTIEDFIASA